MAYHCGRNSFNHCGLCGSNRHYIPSSSDDDDDETSTDSDAGYDDLIRETLLACAMLRLDPTITIAKLKARRDAAKKRAKRPYELPLDDAVKFIENSPDAGSAKTQSNNAAATASTSAKSKRKRRRNKKKKQTKKTVNDDATSEALAEDKVDEDAGLQQDDAEGITAAENGLFETQCGSEDAEPVFNEDLVCANNFTNLPDANAEEAAAVSCEKPGTQLTVDNLANATSKNPPAKAVPTTKATERVLTKSAQTPKASTTQVQKSKPCSFSFEADYYYQLVCINCIASLKANGMVELCVADQLSAHICPQNLLLASPRHNFAKKSDGEMRWCLIRELPDDRASAYVLCLHVERGEAWSCANYPYCSLPHNDVERVIWSKCKSDNFDIGAFIKSHRRRLPSVDVALANLFATHRGRFLLVCRTCFASRRYSPSARNGLCCEPPQDLENNRPKTIVVRHPWRENECLVHCKGDRFIVRPIEPVPPPTHGRKWQHLTRYSLCEHGAHCTAPRCTNAHTRIELSVWQLERIYEDLTRAELVARNESLVNGSAQQSAVAVATDAFELGKNLQSYNMESVDSESDVDPADILPRDGRKKATMISMAMECEDDGTGDYNFEMKLTKRQQRTFRKLAKQELAEERQREELQEAKRPETVPIEPVKVRYNITKADDQLAEQQKASICGVTQPRLGPNLQPTNPGFSLQMPAARKAAFSLEAEFKFQLVCIDCISAFTPLNEVDYRTVLSSSEMGHICHQKLLIVQSRSADASSPRWSLIRDPGNRSSSYGAICDHITAGRRCPRLLFCDYAHNEEERLIWSRIRSGLFDMDAFINRNRVHFDTLEAALNRLFDDHPGRFVFLCRACYMNPEQRTLAGACVSGEYCENPQAKHFWEENACLLHCRSETQFSVRPIETRPLATHQWKHLIRFAMCYGGVGCSEPRCMNAHSRVELAVWRFERAFPHCSREMLVDLSTRSLLSSRCKNPNLLSGFKEKF